MSRTLLSLAGFQVILIGRFWVIAEEALYLLSYRAWRPIMNAAEKDMLEELKGHLKLRLHKDCVDAYLNDPGSSAIVQVALEKLQKATHEADKP